MIFNKINQIDSGIFIDKGNIVVTGERRWNPRMVSTLQSDCNQLVWSIK